MARRHKYPIIGWREYVCLPDLGLPAVKAKIDTGARSSSIHAFDMQVGTHRGVRVVNFEVHPHQRNARGAVEVTAEIIDERMIRSSTGHQQQRLVIWMDLELGEQRWTSEVTLARRDQMGFRMLLGREAVRRRFLVDPSASYLAGRRKPTA